MADTMHAFLNERLRLGLSGHIPGHQLDALIATLSHLFKTVRPDLTPEEVLVAISEPSVCGSQYCSCHSADSLLHKYKMTIFVDRKEQGRRVTKPWVRASSEVGFGDVVDALVRRCGELVGETERKKVVKEEEAEAEKESRRKVLGTERFERKGGVGKGVGLVEVFERVRGRERGFTVPSSGLGGGGRGFK
ncbi:hypothetical protein P171DRAFT_476931 [Karstenula rhodostoma CBS 690.94]|uniref:Uncharacterized protein n=1 Tax=Karstenula rhodostoma CBS 690.94 TaxID=1392251 RepID=A0A9P4P9U3_9PLEO|nr:hypothetical protein P171DRAFT_476931 [Karstenula rhodostoma CBS 690.94]